MTHKSERYTAFPWYSARDAIWHGAASLLLAGLLTVTVWWAGSAYAADFGAYEAIADWS